jgi:hypothetical protein
VRLFSSSVALVVTCCFNRCFLKSIIDEVSKMSDAKASSPLRRTEVLMPGLRLSSTPMYWYQDWHTPSIPGQIISNCVWVACSRPIALHSG